MNNSTQILEDKIKAIAESLAFISSESSFLNKYYFDSGASTLVSALATNGTPATVASKLTKIEVTNGITMIQELEDFFGNDTVSTGDYQSSADNLINGSDPATSALSNDVENIGTRLMVLGQNLGTTRSQAADAVKLYSSSELSTIIGSLAASTVIFGCSTSQTKMLGGIVLLQQFIKFMNNEAVTQGDYQDTIAKWLA